MGFRFESNMYDVIFNEDFFPRFLGKLERYEQLYYGIEIGNIFGIPDIIIAKLVNGKTIRTCAIELKLANWRRALEQAFKYRSFADYSFVVLDNSKISSALNNISEFSNRNIGLIGLDINGKIFDYSIPKMKAPYSPVLLCKMNELIEEGRHTLELIE